MSKIYFHSQSNSFRNETLSHNIMLELSKLNVIGFSCTGAPEAEYMEGGLKPVFKLKDVLAGQCSINSSNEVAGISNHFNRTLENSKMKIKVLQEPELFFRGGYKDRTSEKINRYFIDKGIQSRVSIRTDTFCGKGWFIIWTLFFSSHLPETKKNVYQNLDRINYLLNHYHRDLLSSDESHFNPFKGPSKLQGKTRKVLELGALGYKTEVISNELSLTKRGVEYHFNRAREILLVNNRIQTLIEASKLGVI